jgi:predicted transcriptional regulator
MTINIKQRAHELIEALPDNATWQDLLYALELGADVEAGLADANAGRVTDSEDPQWEYGRRR